MLFTVAGIWRFHNFSHLRTKHTGQNTPDKKEENDTHQGKRNTPDKNMRPKHIKIHVENKIQEVMRHRRDNRKTLTYPEKALLPIEVTEVGMYTVSRTAKQ